MQVTTDVSKILKTFQGDLTFIFDVISRSLFGFVSCLVFQATENVVSFTKKCFYRKQGSTTMRNYAETFQATYGYNMEQKLLTKQLSCRKQKFFLNGIYFCFHETSFFYFKQFFLAKVSQNTFNFNRIESQVYSIFQCDTLP